MLTDTENKKLQILLLGTPVIFYADQPLTIKRQSLRAILYYLACHRDMVSRPEVIVLFWPDASEKDGRRHFREALSRLRAMLPEPDLILTDYDYVGLDHNRVYVDVLAFQELQLKVQRNHLIPNDKPLPDPIFHYVKQAVDLWRLPEFFAGANFSYSVEWDEWKEALEQSLSFQRRHLEVRLADHYAAMDEYENAVKVLHKAIEFDIYNTDLYYRMVVWLRKAGQINDAKEVCRQVKILADEGLEIPPQLIRLCKELQHESGFQTPGERKSWQGDPIIKVPFVGRTKELAELNKIMIRGGGALISAEAGAGKSRLVLEFYNSLQPSPRILFAAGRPLEKDLPFQPLIDTLRNSILPEEWKALDQIWKNQIASLLPELNRFNSEPAILDIHPAEDARGLLFEALRQLFLQISSREKILMILDDAQWCDRATFEVLAYQIERDLFNGRGMFVLIRRIEEPNDYLEEFINHTRIAEHIVQMDLELLNKDEVFLLANYALGQAVTDELVDRLIKDSGGNPLFVLETLRLILDKSYSKISIEELDKLPLATSIYALVRERVKRVSTSARQVFMAASVVGNEFGMQFIRDLINISSEGLVNALEELENAHLIEFVAETGGATTYRFIHDQIREIMYSELSKPRRMLLHSKIARMMEKEYADHHQFAPIIANHFECSDEWHEAFYYWLKSAAYAKTIFSFQEAFSFYKKAENIIEQNNLVAKVEEIFMLYSQWGKSCLLVHQLDQASYCFAKLSGYGEKYRSDLLIGAALSGSGYIFYLKKQIEPAMNQTVKAIELLENSSDRLTLSIAYYRFAIIKIFTHRPVEAIEILQKEIALIEFVKGDEIREVLGESEFLLCYLYNMVGWPEKSITIANKIIVESQSGGNLFYEAQARETLGLAYYYLEQYDQAVVHLEEAFQIFHHTLANSNAIIIMIHLGYCYFARGEMQKGREMIQQIGKLMDETSNFQFEDQFYYLQGLYYYQILDYPKAEYFLRKGVTISGDLNNILSCKLLLSVLLTIKKEYADAKELLGEIDQAARESELEFIRLYTKLAWAGYYLSRGKYEKVTGALTGVQEESKRRKLSTLALWVNTLQIRKLLAVQSFEAVTPLVEETLILNQTVKNPWIETEIYRLVAQSDHPLNQDYQHKLTATLDETEHNLQNDTDQMKFREYRVKIESTGSLGT